MAARGARAYQVSPNNSLRCLRSIRYCCSVRVFSSPHLPSDGNGCGRIFDPLLDASEYPGSVAAFTLQIRSCFVQRAELLSRHLQSSLHGIARLWNQRKTWDERCGRQSTCRMFSIQPGHKRDDFGSSPQIQDPFQRARSDRSTERSFFLSNKWPTDEATSPSTRLRRSGCRSLRL